MGSSARSSTTLIDDFEAVRAYSESLCEPLETEDYVVQPMVDASPPKWHLAHTTWFFETFLLKPFEHRFAPFHERYEYLFNSYYEAVGARHPRSARGLLSRPLLKEVLAYREQVNARMCELISRNEYTEVRARVLLGLHHEQQHQELILTDLKSNLGKNPLRPAYRPDLSLSEETQFPPQVFDPVAGGVIEIGLRPEDPEFCFDNETPRHRVLLADFELSRRLVTNGEYLEFMQDGGYQKPALWLSDGWTERQQRGWTHPEYWTQRDDAWFEYTLAGERRLNPAAPVVHVSGYEADAFARWSGARLPTEFEWERVAQRQGSAKYTSAFSSTLHPQPATATEEITQLFGDCWEWTMSSYSAYPGYVPLAGALGEYNGKFMANQLVLRGGSCATPPGHIRPTYRNFFYPRDRWQFSGIRLAHDSH